MNIFARFHSGACCAALLLASVGCGGGGSAPAKNSDPSPEPQTIATAVAPVYTSTEASKDFVAFVRKRDQGPHDFYALNYVSSSTTSAVIYSGQVMPGFNGNADMRSLKRMDSNGELKDSSAVLTNISASTMTVVFDKDPNASFQAEGRTSAGASISGDWTGVWIDGLKTNNRYTIKFSNVDSLALSRILDCDDVELVLSPYEGTSGLYPVRIKYPDQITVPERHNGCGSRLGKELSGLAAVYSLNGKTRLNIVAVDAFGSGISFRAEHP